MAEPAFSVIVPTWNRPGLLARALASVIAQRGATFEVIVADDGAGDGLPVARAVAGASVIAFETGGRGQVPARNLAVTRAAGRWIAFLDDDDWWAADDHLARLAAVLADGPGLAYASGRIVRETADGQAIGELPFTAHADANALRSNNTLLIPGLAYDRDLHRGFGPFDETLPVYWDWDWYLRLAAAGVRFVDGGGTGVRVSARSDTVSAPVNEGVRRTELARLCERHGLVGVELKNHDSIAVEQQRNDERGRL